MSAGIIAIDRLNCPSYRVCHAVNCVNIIKYSPLYAIVDFLFIASEMAWSVSSSDELDNETLSLLFVGSIELQLVHPWSVSSVGRVSTVSAAASLADFTAIKQRQNETKKTIQNKLTELAFVFCFLVIIPRTHQAHSRGSENIYHHNIPDFNSNAFGSISITVDFCDVDSFALLIISLFGCCWFSFCILFRNHFIWI